MLLSFAFQIIGWIWYNFMELFNTNKLGDVFVSGLLDCGGVLNHNINRRIYNIIMSQLNGLH